jgi:putative tricarboxylic transport membrane protein
LRREVTVPADTRDVSPVGPPRRRIVRSPRNLAAGLALLAIAAVALQATVRLDVGRLRAMGPGMLPRSVAALVGLSGLLLVAASLLRDGPPLSRWRLRGPVLVSLAILGFAATIRSVGLVVAGLLVVMVGGAASPEFRWKELAVFGVVVTAACVALFRYALGLPIPVLVVPGLLRL